jgi:hypothetical protein
MGQRDDADAANLDPAGDPRGRRRDQPVALAIQIGTVVGDEPSAGIDQAQREVGFAAAGLAEQQDAGAAEFDTAGVNLDVRRPRAHNGRQGVAEMPPLSTAVQQRRRRANINLS